MFGLNIKILAIVIPETSVTKIKLERKKKWTKEGNDTYMEADTLLHNTTSHTQYLYQISKS